MKNFFKERFPKLLIMKNLFKTPILNYKYMKIKKANIIILMYHRISKLEYDPFEISITPDVFEKHIEFISKNYNVLTFDTSWENIKEKSIIITFDDGYVDNYINALPILEKYKVPATFFIATGNIGKVNEYWDLDFIRMIKYRQKDKFILDGKEYELNKSNEEKVIREIHFKLYSNKKLIRDKLIKELEKELNPTIKYIPLYRNINELELKKMSESKYVTIGAHTVNHCRLFIEDYKTQCYEIKESKKRLERIINKPVKYFAYPFGKNIGENLDFSKETIEILRKYDFEKAVTVGNLSVKRKYDKYQIPRISVNKNWANYNFDDMLKFYSLFR